MLLFFVSITVPFFISGVMTYQKYSASVEERTKLYATQVMEQITINVNQYFQNIDKLTMVTYYDENVLGIFRKHQGDYDRNVYVTADESLKMNLFISSLSFDRPEIRGIFLFANDGSLFNNLDQLASNRWHPEGNDWMEQVRAADGAFVLLPPHVGHYYRNRTDLNFSAARWIKDPADNRPLGYIKIDLSPDTFARVLSSVSLSHNNQLYVTDRRGNVFYPTPKEGESVDIPTGDFIDFHGEKYLKTDKASDYTGLKIIGLVPIKDLQKDAKQLTRFTLVISVASLLFAYIMAVYFSKRMVLPIRHLQMKMKKVQKGEFSERAVVHSRDEIGQLSEGFNIMVGEIDRLVKEVYETKIGERDAQLAALQSQMNPHFLYNTLEMINMLAIQQKPLEVSDIVSSLGKLLRYTVDQSKTLVHLKEEVKFVQAYLKIQSFRYGERLNMDIQVDPALECCLIPKLMIQPLIENAIQHGIGESSGTVCLTISASGNDIVVCVQDDGPGMTPEQIEEIEAKLYRKSAGVREREAFGTERKGFALRNVHQRLRLLYGEPYGLRIDQSGREGSLFILRIPMQWEGEDQPHA
jgi:two-component system sensor histidine kinase YesM